MTDKQKSFYGLIGYPVKHSLSPKMHNAAFSALGINAEYLLYELEENKIGSFLEKAPASSISGVNITVPYKEKVIPFLKKISAEAGLIGAVNTIKVNDGKLEGFNTDGEGFIKHLKEDLEFNPAHRRVALIGAGGASRAVSVYLSKSGVKQLSIFDVDINRAESLIRHLRDNFSAIDYKAAATIVDLDINGADLLINATPIGMKEADPLLVDEKLIHPGQLVYDLIYNPKETKLLKAARLKGAAVSNGLGMLLYQGMVAFEIWTGKPAPKEVMQKALYQAL